MSCSETRKYMYNISKNMFGYFQDYEQIAPGSMRLSLESTSSESSVSRTSSLGSASRFILPDDHEGGENPTQEEWSHL